jgi:predicted MFS family arabinose efflux permease
MQQINGYSALRGGIAFLPAGLATLTAALVGTRLVTRLGARHQLVLGPLLAAGGFVWLTVLSPGNGYFDHIFGPLVMTGFGFGLSFVPMTLTATGGLPPSQAGLAAGLINTTRQVGGAIGLAIMGTVASNAASQNNGTAKSVASALTNGYDRAFLIGACALLSGVALALLLPRGNRAGATNEARVTARPRTGRCRPHERRRSLSAVGGMRPLSTWWGR